MEANENGLKVHRKGTSPIPDLSVIKKRDIKASDKEEQKGTEEPKEDALPSLDERGNPVL